MRRFFSIIVLSLALFGCTEFTEQQSETLSEGTYAVPAAIANGRIDQADSIANSLKLFVNPPKTLLKISPVLDPNTKLPEVILPSYLTGKVVVVGSADYQLLLKNKQINNQLAKDNDNLINYKTQAEKQKIADQKTLNDAVNQLNKYKKSIFYKAYLWFDTLTYIFPLSIIIVIVVCIFCPALVGPILTILGNIFGIFFNIFNSILGGIGSAISSISRKTTTITTK